LIGVFAIPPSGPVLGVDQARRIGESWDWFTIEAAFGDWVATSPRISTMPGRPFSRFGQGYQGNAAKAHVATAPPDHCAQYPSFGAGYIHDKVQAIAVSISSRLRNAAYLDCRQRGVWVLFARLHRRTPIPSHISERM
jgi:hypothetical protein